ncbi:MAG: hypothetical protein ACFFDF_11415 [Candidatus Odinarchaeota archaeon]
MVTRQISNKALIFLIIISFSVSIASISLNNSQRLNFTKNEEQRIPEIALPPLSYGRISQNVSEVYRSFESINFTINAIDFSGANYTKMQISFTNGTIREFNMQFIGDNEFNAIYKPKYNSPLGMQNVSFLIYNETNHLLNSHTTHTNFTINSNFLVTLYNSENQQSSEYYINNTLYAEIMVSNFKTYNFTWNITIVDNLDELVQKDTINFERNIAQFTADLNNETFGKNKFYYVQLNMTDKNFGKKGTAYFPFYVKNNNPIISSSIKLSPQEVFRTDEFTISLNVTDIESKSEDLIPQMYIYDSEGELVIQNLIAFDSNNLFSETFSIPANRPVGKYRVNVTLTDENGGSSSKITYLTVKNNAPEIHSYTINGKNMDQAISIFYGRNLVFSFNVSDIEGVAYVKVALLNENNVWFNITRSYIGTNTETTIRTYDLGDGVWYVYIYVIDTDGTIVSLIDDYDKAPQGIRIIPDIVGYYLPWILLFGGLGFGLLLGVVTTFSYFRAKREPQSITSKTEESVVKKKIIKKREKKRAIKEEPEEKETEELKPEKEKEEIPQRKIKRKL